MIDHISLSVADLQKTREFYLKVFEPLEFKVWVDEKEYVGFGTQERPHFWINQGDRKHHVHIAFPAKNRKTVDAFYDIALKNGAVDNGKPGLRPEYHENYYGAFVIDPDGNNIEAVCHKPE
jgi:catechol 2,3-dioxygenase-like lactoylglutathione lyase family enzyme